MFKKTLAAAAILGAFAGSAFAADVTLYGKMDLGLGFTNTSVDGADDVNSFQMKSGQNSGNRFGLKGTEDLGNGMKVGFSLENGFEADDGTLNNNGRLFGREALLYVQGAFGEVSFGRAGQLMSGNGRYGIFTSNVNALGTGWGDVVGLPQISASGYARFDNLVTYQTPSFAGFTVTVQYSMKNDSGKDKDGKTADEGDENKANVDRYYGIGAQYKNGPFQAVAIVDSINYDSTALDATGKQKYEDDALNVALGGSYDFGVVKAYLAGTYSENAKEWGKLFTFAGNVSTGNDYSATVDGYGVMASVDVPAFGGTAKFGIGYSEAEQSKVASGEDKPEFKTYTVGAGYTYNLSKRTMLYTAADYVKADYNKAANTPDADAYTVIAGMVHSF